MNDKQQLASDGEIADVQPSTSADDPSNWDFADPDDDQDNQEEPTSKDTPDGADEADEGQEAEQSEANDEANDSEGEQDGEEAETESAEQSEAEPEAATITLKSGEQISLDEAVNGYMRDGDYRRKTQAVADQRRQVEASTNRIQGVVDKLTEHLANQLPSEPDFALSQTDPASYMAQKALYDAQVNNLQQLIAMGGEAKSTAQEMSAADHQALVSEENAKLAERFPTTANEKGRKAFFEKAGSAAENLGYSSDEISKTTDSRLFGLAYYAQIGMEAQEAKKTAKVKVAEAPKAAPKKQANQTGSKARANADAMRRLNSTGSIRDAMGVDWD